LAKGNVRLSNPEVSHEPSQLHSKNAELTVPMERAKNGPNGGDWKYSGCWSGRQNGNTS
jgi:hypothetical protein